MLASPSGSQFRVEKERVDAVLMFANGDSTPGAFFVAKASARHAGSERVGELLNSELGFFPFEKGDGGDETVLYNRGQVVIVALASNEARRDPGYDVATERFVSVLLSNGHTVAGAVRVYCPEGRDRLSDWARHPDAFRYLETGETTLLVNIAHVVEVREVPRP